MTKEDLKAIRESLGLSQRGFARRIGVAPKTIARWEAGIHPIGLVYEKLIRIQATVVKLSQTPGKG